MSPRGELIVSIMDLNTPQVSVIIPTYNRARLLPRAIRSVLSQTFTDFELIIVDDASTDETDEVVGHWSDPRIRYVRHERNLGGGAARNTGIAMALGEFVAFLDSDDEWVDSKLAEQLSLVDSTGSEFGAFYTNAYVVRGNLVVLDSLPKYQGDLRRHLLGGWCPSMMSSMLIRRSVLPAAPFDRALQSYQDYDFWLFLSETVTFGYLPRCLVLLHQDAGDRLGKVIERRRRALQMLEEKWRSRLCAEELALFQGFLQKQQQTIVLNECVARMEGKPVSYLAREVLRSANRAAVFRKLLATPLRSLMGDEWHQAWRVRRLKRSGLFVGYYVQGSVPDL